MNGAANPGVLVEFLLDQHGLLDTMLTIHVDDGSGHCSTCGGHSGRDVFPCYIKHVADRAAELRRQRAASPTEKDSDR